MEDFELFGGMNIRVHNRGDCKTPEVCVIHNPSDHPYRHLPMGMDYAARMIRYTNDGLYMIDPDSARYFDITILRNSAKCHKCNSHIQSTYRHDFVSCKCNEVFVDGGFEDYVRHGFTNTSTYEDTSLYLEK